mmetsp:Transcript_7788/g.29246  ORF Transcript_7788/g.29246 Transcript_7788/m.29246 type:complete len:435 (+) Transcript_7788:323-1627(+)
MGALAAAGFSSAGFGSDAPNVNIGLDLTRDSFFASLEPNPPADAPNTKAGFAGPGAVFGSLAGTASFAFSAAFFGSAAPKVNAPVPTLNPLLSPELLVLDPNLKSADPVSCEGVVAVAAAAAFSGAAGAGVAVSTLFAAEPKVKPKLAFGFSSGADAVASLARLDMGRFRFGASSEALSALSVLLLFAVNGTLNPVDDEGAFAPPGAAPMPCPDDSLAFGSSPPLGFGWMPGAPPNESLGASLSVAAVDPPNWKNGFLSGASGFVSGASGFVSALSDPLLALAPKVNPLALGAPKVGLKEAPNETPTEALDVSIEGFSDLRSAELASLAAFGDGSWCSVDFIVPANEKVEGELVAFDPNPKENFDAFACPGWSSLLPLFSVSANGNALGAFGAANVAFPAPRPKGLGGFGPSTPGLAIASFVSSASFSALDAAN